MSKSFDRFNIFPVYPSMAILNRKSDELLLKLFAWNNKFKRSAELKLNRFYGGCDVEKLVSFIDINFQHQN